MTDINPQTFDLLKEILSEIREGQKQIEKKVDDGFGKMNGRVRKLENWRWYMLGMMPVFSFVIYLVAMHLVGK